jgi:hypothetical protein
MGIPYIPNHSPCMAKLDRLSWADGVSFMAYGVHMGVRVSDAQVMPSVREILPPGAEMIESAEVERLVSFQVGGPGPQPRQKRYHLVYADLGRLGRTHDLDEALHSVEASAQLLVAMSAPSRVFIHAGVVAWNGRAILLPGRSFAGKSTLVAALLRAGAEYYSDEYAVLDERGYVHAYPRPLSLRDNENAPRLRPTAEDLGSRTGEQPIPVGLIAMTHYRPGACWSPRPTPTSKAALALLDNAVAIRHEPERCLVAIERVVTAADCITGNRGEAAETAEQLLAACA